MNLAKLAREFVEKNSYLKTALEDDVLNYSAVARNIISKHKISNPKAKDALIIALRRLKPKIRVKHKKSEPINFTEKTFENISVIVFKKTISSANLYKLEKELVHPGKPFFVLKGTNGTSVITVFNTVELVRSAVPEAVKSVSHGFRLKIRTFNQSVETKTTLKSVSQIIPELKEVNGNLLVFQNHLLLLEKTQ